MYGKEQCFKSNKNFLEGVASKFGIPLYFWHDMGINCPQYVPNKGLNVEMLSVINKLFTIEGC